LTLIVFVLRSYVDELKWRTSTASEPLWVARYWTCCWRVASTSTPCVRAGGHFVHMQ